MGPNIPPLFTLVNYVPKKSLTNSGSLISHSPSPTKPTRGVKSSRAKSEAEEDDAARFFGQNILKE